MEKMGNNCPLVLLAAGDSRRMGTPKGLVRHQESPWLETQLESFRQSGGRRACVVLGFHAERYFEALDWLSPDRGKEVAWRGLEVSVAVNATPQLGQFSSLQCALKTPNLKNAWAVFVLPVDVPAATAAVWNELILSMQGDVMASLPSHQNRGGHPVLLSSQWIRELVLLPAADPQSRLDLHLALLSASQIRRVPTADARVCMNLNNPEDWDAFTHLMADERP